MIHNHNVVIYPRQKAFHDCSFCGLGYFLRGEHCLQCPSGKFSVSQNSTSCFTCSSVFKSVSDSRILRQCSQPINPITVRIKDFSTKILEIRIEEELPFDISLAHSYFEHNIKPEILINSYTRAYLGTECMIYTDPAKSNAVFIFLSKDTSIRLGDYFLIQSEFLNYFTSKEQSDFYFPTGTIPSIQIMPPNNYFPVTADVSITFFLKDSFVIFDGSDSTGIGGRLHDSIFIWNIIHRETVVFSKRAQGQSQFIFKLKDPSIAQYSLEEPLKVTLQVINWLSTWSDPVLVQIPPFAQVDETHYLPQVEIIGNQNWEFFSENIILDSKIPFNNSSYIPNLVIDYEWSIHVCGKPFNLPESIGKYKSLFLTNQMVSSKLLSLSNFPRDCEVVDVKLNATFYFRDELDMITRYFSTTAFFTLNLAFCNNSPLAEILVKGMRGYSDFVSHPSFEDLHLQAKGSTKPCTVTSQRILYRWELKCDGIQMFDKFCDSNWIVHAMNSLELLSSDLYLPKEVFLGKSNIFLVSLTELYVDTLTNEELSSSTSIVINICNNLKTNAFPSIEPVNVARSQNMLTAGNHLVHAFSRSDSVIFNILMNQNSLLYSYLFYWRCLSVKASIVINAEFSRSPQFILDANHLRARFPNSIFKCSVAVLPSNENFIDQEIEDNLSIEKAAIHFRLSSDEIIPTLSAQKLPVEFLDGISYYSLHISGWEVIPRNYLRKCGLISASRSEDRNYYSLMSTRRLQSIVALVLNNETWNANCDIYDGKEFLYSLQTIIEPSLENNLASDGICDYIPHLKRAFKVHDFQLLSNSLAFLHFISKDPCVNDKSFEELITDFLKPSKDFLPWILQTDTQQLTHIMRSILCLAENSKLYFAKFFIGISLRVLKVLDEYQPINIDKILDDITVIYSNYRFGKGDPYEYLKIPSMISAFYMNQITVPFKWFGPIKSSKIFSSSHSSVEIPLPLLSIDKFVFSFFKTSVLSENTTLSVFRNEPLIEYSKSSLHNAFLISPMITIDFIPPGNWKERSPISKEMSIAYEFSDSLNFDVYSLQCSWFKFGKDFDSFWSPANCSTFLTITPNTRKITCECSLPDYGASIAIVSNQTTTGLEMNQELYSVISAKYAWIFISYFIISMFALYIIIFTTLSKNSSLLPAIRLPLSSFKVIAKDLSSDGQNRNEYAQNVNRLEKLFIVIFHFSILCLCNIRIFTIFLQTFFQSSLSIRYLGCFQGIFSGAFLVYANSIFFHLWMKNLKHCLHIAMSGRIDSFIMCNLSLGFVFLLIVFLLTLAISTFKLTYNALWVSMFLFEALSCIILLVYISYAVTAREELISISRLPENNFKSIDITKSKQYMNYIIAFALLSFFHIIVWCFEFGSIFVNFELGEKALFYLSYGTELGCFIFAFIFFTPITSEKVISLEEKNNCPLLPFQIWSKISRFFREISQYLMAALSRNSNDHINLAKNINDDLSRLVNDRCDYRSEKEIDIRARGNAFSGPESSSLPFNDGSITALRSVPYVDSEDFFEPNEVRNRSDAITPFQAENSGAFGVFLPSKKARF